MDRENLCKPCNSKHMQEWVKKNRLRYMAHSLRLESFEAGWKWVNILTLDPTRCAICGIPKWKVEKLGSWKHGGYRCNQRLSLDHIQPGVNNGNYRPLCYSCNTVRSNAQFTDAEVLQIMRDWYEWKFTLRKLYWLNTHVDTVTGLCVGGRPYRTERMEAKFAELEGD